jgi:hypothetical protein
MCSILKYLIKYIFAINLYIYQGMRLVLKYIYPGDAPGWVSDAEFLWSVFGLQRYRYIGFGWTTLSADAKSFMVIFVFSGRSYCNNAVETPNLPTFWTYWNLGPPPVFFDARDPPRRTNCVPWDFC